MTRAKADRAVKALADAGHPELADTLAALLAAVAAAAAEHPDLAAAIVSALDVRPGSTTTAGSRSRRKAPEFDPYVVFIDEREDGLRNRLASLSVEQLKDIVAAHQMDRDKLAMKWKTPSRLIERIVETVLTRETHGDGFR